MDADRAIARLADRQHGLVTRSQALRCGLTGSGINRRLNSESFVPLHPGVYRLAGTQRTLDQSILAARLAAGGDTVASHSAAAYLLHLPVADQIVEITVAHGRHVQLGGVVVHQSRRRERVDTLLVGAIPVTSVARTIIDLASVLTPAALEDVVDHALANRLIPIGYLAKRLGALGFGRDGAAKLSAVLRARPTGRRPRQSDVERTLLTALTEAGIRRPERQAPIALPGGTWAFVDLCYPAEKLIIEVDSYTHHSSLPDWEADHLRNQELVELMWRVLPITASEIKRDPGAAAQKVRRALAPDVRRLASG
jgi:very-short-patch-repair endonuclease